MAHARCQRGTLLESKHERGSSVPKTKQTLSVVGSNPSGKRLTLTKNRMTSPCAFRGDRHCAAMWLSSPLIGAVQDSVVPKRFLLGAQKGLRPQPLEARLCGVPPKRPADSSHVSWAKRRVPFLKILKAMAAGYNCDKSSLHRVALFRWEALLRSCQETTQCHRSRVYAALRAGGKRGAFCPFAL